MKILKQKSVWNTTCTKWQCIDPGNIERKEKRPKYVFCLLSIRCMDTDVCSTVWFIGYEVIINFLWTIENKISTTIKTIYKC